MAAARSWSSWQRLGGANLEDSITVLDSRTPDTPVEEDVSLKLLRHFASSVRHQQYLDTDIVMVNIDPRGRKAA